jgi:hypothetical protein
MTTSSSDQSGKKSKLGGVFANVKRTRTLVEAQNKQYSYQPVTVTCPHCGAPQEVTLSDSLRCAYCDEPIAAPPPGPSQEEPHE